MQRNIAILVSLAVLGGCASAPSTPTPTSGPPDLTPEQAVFGAAGDLDGIAGTFKFEVKEVGRQNGWLYVNSEYDYRDQRCLTIAFPPKEARQLEASLPMSPENFLVGKTVLVSGVARRVTVWFMAQGKRTDKYYYQTHVDVADLQKFSVLTATGVGMQSFRPQEGDQESVNVTLLSAADRAPNLRFQPAPHFRYDSKFAGSRARVVVDVSIDDTGEVTDVRLVSADPEAVGPPIAASFRQARYSAAQSGGSPVPCIIRVQVTLGL